MAYNTTTIGNVFAALYTKLRRVYSQYASNYGAKQYLVFANVVLKRPDRIPYYTTVQGAHDKNNPAGYLPTGISGYYFMERPVYFYDRQSFMDWRIASKAGYNMTSNPPYIILNLFLGTQYADVVVNYDSSKMDLEFYAVDANLLVVEEKRITELHAVIDNAINELSIAYNQVHLLELARADGRYKNDNFLYRATYGAKPLVDGWISSLQRDPRFILKVCKECGNNAQLGAVSLPTYITMAGAVSLTFLAKSYTQLPAAKYFIDERLIEIERLRVGLDNEWKLLNGYVPSPEVDVPSEDPAVITATIKKTNWLIPALIALVAVVAVSGSGSNSKKEKN